MVNRSNKLVLVSFFEPQQVVFSEGGAAKLVNSMRMLLKANPNFILVNVTYAMRSTAFLEHGY
jgi:hypothetical protein